MKNLYFKLRQKLLINALTHAMPGVVKPFVLCYHQIDTGEVDAQLTALKKKFEIVDLSTFIARLKENRQGAYCTLTLDDCLQKDVAKAEALWEKHQLPLTLFLPVRFSLTRAALPGTKVQRLLETRSKFRLNGLEFVATAENRDAVKNQIHAHFHPARYKIDEFDKVVKAWFAENSVIEEDIISEGDKIIGQDEVVRLAKKPPFNFQSHTFNHESLGLCSPEEIEFELSESKKVLQQITQKDIMALCYPYGSKEVIGGKVFSRMPHYYSCGLSLVQGVCSRNTDLYFIPRIGIYPGDDLNRFWGKIYHYMQVDSLKALWKKNK
ncbi:MAG: polysaccharide deacetylase family protein [Bacteroidota bacterium]